MEFKKKQKSFLEPSFDSLNFIFGMLFRFMSAAVSNVTDICVFKLQNVFFISVNVIR